MDDARPTAEPGRAAQGTASARRPAPARGAQGGPAEPSGLAGPSRAEGPDTLDLRHAAHALWSRRRLVASVAALVTLAALAAALLIEPRYTAAAQLLISGRENNVIDIEGVATSLEPGEETVSTEIGTILSNAVLERVVLALDLAQDPSYGAEPAPGLLTAPLRRLGLAPAEPEAASLDRAVAALRRSLDVAPRGRSFIVDVAVTADAPGRAALMADAVAEAYLATRAERAAADADRAAAFLARQVRAMAEEIEAAEARMSGLRAERLDAFGESPATTEARLARVADRVAAAQADRAEAEARAALVDALENSPDGLAALPEVVGSELVGRLGERIGELRAREASLLTRSGPRHPDLVALRAEIADRSAQRDAEIAHIAEGLRREVERARDAEASLGALTGGLERRLVEQDGATARIAALQAEIDAAKALHRTFLARSREVAGTAALLAPDARVVSDARPPLHPSGPSRRLIVALGPLLGLALGALIALLREALDPTAPPGSRA